MKNIIEELHGMNSCLCHRGPDGGGVWESPDGAVALGHRRLSIIDLSNNGSQPMISASGRYVIAFNGEIYNFRELSQRLLAEGAVRGFKSSSDTEVLLEAIDAYGLEGALKLCKGMFAIAVFDILNGELLLARDRMGEKPLYYGFLTSVSSAGGNGSGRAFVFASELNAIRGISGFNNQINRKVLGIYMNHGYIPAPYTIYEDIFKLEAGGILRIKAPYTVYETSKYWDIEKVAKTGMVNPFKGSPAEASSELERLLKEAIRGQMISDVPLGAFLSAGIDSSTIVSLMQSLSATPIKTFTIGMDNEEYNEARYAAEIAGILGTEHHEFYISPQDAKAVIPKLAGMFSEPFADSSQIPTYLVSRLTKGHVTVALSGDAGDELFCGYNVYSSVRRVWDKIKRIPAHLRGPLANVGLKLPMFQSRMRQVQLMRLKAENPAQLYEYFNMGEGYLTGLVKGLTDIPYKYNEYKWNGESLSDTLMLMDQLMYLPDDILTKVDRCAMAVSLETRIPLLDRDVVEFAWSLPVDYKKKDGITKLPMRDILYKYIPREIMERPKKGFSIPMEKWFMEGELREWAEELLRPSKIKAEGFLDERVVERLWKDFTEGGLWREMIWHVLAFENWLGE